MCMKTCINVDDSLSPGAGFIIFSPRVCFFSSYLGFGKRKAEHFYACNHCGLDRRLDDAVVGILTSVDRNGETDNAYLSVSESNQLDLKGLAVSKLQVGSRKPSGGAAQHVMQCCKGGLAIYANSGTFCLAATNRMPHR